MYEKQWHLDSADPQRAHSTERAQSHKYHLIGYMKWRRWEWNDVSVAPLSLSIYNAHTPHRKHWHETNEKKCCVYYDAVSISNANTYLFVCAFIRIYIHGYILDV